MSLDLGHEFLASHDASFNTGCSLFLQKTTIQFKCLEFQFKTQFEIIYFMKTKFFSYPRALLEDNEYT